MKHNDLSISQAAAQLGLSREAIYGAVRRQSVPSRWHAGRLVVREADLIAWSANRGKGGRPKGEKLNEEHRARISLAQKKRWAKRKAQDS